MVSATQWWGLWRSNLTTFIPPLSGCRIRYVPYSLEFSAPGDRRRFVYYAKKRGIDIEVADINKEYDVVVLSERADISLWCKWQGGKIVYDLIDPYLAIPPDGWKARLRGIAKYFFGQSRYLQLNYRDAVINMCCRADAVICTTEEQKRDIGAYCGNTHIVLDIHKMLVTEHKLDYKPHDPFRLVWEGLPVNSSSLDLLVQVIDSVSQKMPVELIAITDRQYYRYLGSIGRTRADKSIERLSPNFRWREWHESNLAANITKCDLAVIPLDLQDPFASGKPENKLLLFWYLGMPVLTSATPAYRTAMQNAGLDLYPKSCNQMKQ